MKHIYNRFNVICIKDLLEVTDVQNVKFIVHIEAAFGPKHNG